MRDRTARMVTADALPTVQIDGVVWTQVMIGNTVFAGGEFTAARPAGAPTGSQETPRGNLLAYDLTTGELKTTFAPGAFNGPVKALAVSADKKVLYVGGDFTMAGTTARGHFAALDPSTGALRTPKASFNGSVNALAVNSTTVFAGGTFTSAGGKKRTRLAAVNAGSGKLTAWKASANRTVKALLLTSGSKLLVVGGSFTKLNSTKASGSGAVSPTTGKTKTWKVNKVVKNGGKASAILALATDGSTVYAGAYTYGTGNFEGVYAASSTDGTLRWLQDCHGDAYGVVPIGDVVYSVGHAHYCSNIGGFPDTSDNSQLRSAWYRGIAVTKTAEGTVAKNTQKSAKTYTDFKGKPAPSLLNWFPHISAGTYTGMFQGAWSIVGNGTYLALGGEFPKAGGVAQEGLVRFAISTVAPNKVGPAEDDSGLVLTATPQPDGRVVLEWNQLWDRDDLTLSYALSRDGTVIDTQTVSVPFWKRSTMSFTDDEVTPGELSNPEYQVTASDPDGNSVVSSVVRVVRPSGPDSRPPNGDPEPARKDRVVATTTGRK
ncbi:MAG: hypothetical protein QM619_06340 [Micropruina sp.]|uniref:hypothetical protein n=1 Tax=Micropruina sp. TaxID=2737536 RepID=UPI0039E46D59